MTRARIAGLFIAFLANAFACSPNSTTREDHRSEENYSARDGGCTPVSFESAESTRLTGELCTPTGIGPFPAVVDLHPRICMGPAGIPPAWEQTLLPSWGYSVLVIDNFVARGLAAGPRNDLNSLTNHQLMADASARLGLLGQTLHH